MTAILFGFATLGINSKFPFQCDQIAGRSDKIIKASTAPFQFGWDEEQPLPNELIPLLEQQTGGQTADSSLIKDTWNKLKTNVRGGFLDTQKSINTKVCNAIVGQLEKVYQNPVFQIGVVFGMYLLFYGAIRLFVWVVTIIGFLLFCITKLFGGYRTEKRLEEVEELL